MPKRTLANISDAIYRYRNAAEAAGVNFKGWDPENILVDLSRPPAKLHQDPYGRGGHRPTDVPVAPFVAAWERSGISKYELATRLGWFYFRHGRHRPDTGRVIKTFGYEKIRRDTADALMEALHLDPMDVGL